MAMEPGTVDLCIKIVSLLHVMRDFRTGDFRPTDPQFVLDFMERASLRLGSVHDFARFVRDELTAELDRYDEILPLVGVKP